MGIGEADSEGDVEVVPEQAWEGRTSWRWRRRKDKIGYGSQKVVTNSLLVSCTQLHFLQVPFVPVAQ